MFNQSAQRTEAYDPNRVTERPFSKEGFQKTLEKMYGYFSSAADDRFNGRHNGFDYLMYFNNQLGAFIDALVNHLIEQDILSRNRPIGNGIVAFNYIFEDCCPQTTGGNNANIIVHEFANSKINEFLTFVGIDSNTVQIGEVGGVNSYQYNISIHVEYQLSTLVSGIEAYSTKLRKDREDDEFRRAVFNINAVLVPKLEELYKLAHHLNDIERVFNLVDDLHTTFIKPKDK